MQRNPFSQKSPKLSKGWQLCMYTLGCRFYIPMINLRSANLRSARDGLSPISHPCGYGAFRFLLWWLFLHRRLRSGNEAQLSSSYFAPFGGSSSEESHSFLSEWFKKASRLSLAEPFGFDSRRHKIDSRLSLLSPSASPHRSPIPSSVSKAVTFVTVALYA